MRVGDSVKMKGGSTLGRVFGIANGKIQVEFTSIRHFDFGSDELVLVSPATEPAMCEKCGGRGHRAHDGYPCTACNGTGQKGQNG